MQQLLPYMGIRRSIQIKKCISTYEENSSMSIKFANIMRFKYENGVSVEALQREFGTGKSATYDILKKKCWYYNPFQYH